MAGTEEILALCYQLGAPEDREELLIPLAEAAARDLAGRLKKGVVPENCGPAFPLAAAMVAVEGLEGAAGGGRVTAFSAGEVTIRTERGGCALSTQAQRLLAPWLEETGFAFRGVAG